MKTCLYCGKRFEAARRWAKFCAAACKKSYWLERQTVVSTPEYNLFLRWRRLIGPITHAELERFADWRRRSLKRSLNRSPLDQKPPEPKSAKQNRKAANP